VNRCISKKGEHPTGGEIKISILIAIRSKITIVNIAQQAKEIAILGKSIGWVLEALPLKSNCSHR
jgi:hypothetical protein